MKAPLLAAAIALAPADAPAIADDDDWVLRPAERHMWARTTRADTVQAYEEYLSLFWRDGKHVAEALARWVDLTHRGDPKALQLPPKGRRARRDMHLLSAADEESGMVLTFQLAVIAFAAFLCASILYLHFYAYAYGSIVLMPLQERLAVEAVLEKCGGR